MMQESLSEPWYSKLLYVSAGGLIVFLTAIARDMLNARRTRKKIRKAILAKIEANEIHAKRELSDFSFVDEVYRANISNISEIKAKSISNIVRYYATIHQFRNRFGDDSGTPAGLEREFQNKTITMYDEIRDLGRKILSDEK